MLILTSSVNERIVIGGCVVVTVVSAEKGRLRIGIEAPDTVVVPATSFIT